MAAHRLILLVFLPFFLVLLAPLPGEAEQKIMRSHAIAMAGQPKYSAGFEHFAYADPEARKGGHVRLSAIGTYDSFNPYISKGVAVTGINLIYDTLTVQSDDEPFTQYGLVAQTIEWPEDRSWVVFHLHPDARFHDGKRIRPEDVVFTFNTLITQGDPTYRKYYAGVDRVEALGENAVRFTFKPDEINAELPLIIGQLPVLPQHFWENRDFSRTSLEIPLGSGPYRIVRFTPGRTVSYERMDGYWAKNHPVNTGRYNFNRITYDYYRDSTVALHAFKSGEYDFREENNSKDWATSYTGPPFRDGMIIKEEIENELPRGMQGFVFNTRRDLFGDRKVRQALSLAFDFEWSNRQLFYGQYTRSKSYFSNSELAASGLPSAEELEILEPLREDLPEEVFTREYVPPVSDVSGFNRQNLIQARDLLREAGWFVRNGKLTNTETGRVFQFEILLVSPAFERIVLPYTRNLAKLGIDASVRVVDTSQYINRLRDFDFDMITFVFGQSNSPGNEQLYFWHSTSADVPGSRNLIGIKNPAIDRLVELVIQAPDRETLITRTRALDRALLWGHYLVPHWHSTSFRVAYWDKFHRPLTTPKYDLGFLNWWVDPERAADVYSYRKQYQNKDDSGT
ncbi:MAG: extracellular solute-binding protein [Desulfovibrionales bacterium]